MATYSKPIVIPSAELAEGVYAASGDTLSLSCNSKYMKGAYHAPDYNNTTSYYGRFGCLGCPAYRWNGCGLSLESYYGSYDTDQGKRMPSWEKLGHTATDAIDWNDVGSL
jgi:hypothetical protein